MAKATLPVNFRDDIMNSSMGGKRRYNVIQNADGTISLEDATTYDQVGSNFGAGQINATNTAVNASADAGKIIDDINAIKAVTQEGYIAGALALKQVNSDMSDLKKSVADGKASVASAISAKGVSTAADATFGTMANNISAISKGLTISNAYSVATANSTFTGIDSPATCTLTTVTNGIYVLVVMPAVFNNNANASNVSCSNAEFLTKNLNSNKGSFLWITDKYVQQLEAYPRITIIKATSTSITVTVSGDYFEEVVAYLLRIA